MGFKLILVVLLTVLLTSVFGQESAEEWLDEGVAFGIQGKDDEAIQAYDEAVKLDPKLAQVIEKDGKIPLTTSIGALSLLLAALFIRSRRS